jgi:hypothetical protein
MFQDANFWLTMVLVAVGGYCLWNISRPKWMLEIVVLPDGVKSCRGLPKAQEQKIVNFLQHDVSLPGKVRIRGTRSRNGRWHIAMAGSLDAGMRQRIRNFLITVL